MVFSVQYIFIIGYTENHLRPCCIIDNPSILRDIVAETVVGCLARPLDEYADKCRVLADEAWENNYIPDEEKEEAV